MASALAAQGKVDRAIEEYRAILPMAPEVRPLLIRLLIQDILRLPADRRSWQEIDGLVASAGRDSPDAIETLILHAEVMIARDRTEEARALLSSACDRHPDRVEPRLALARLLSRREQWGPALNVLDEARRQLGDRAALRLERARIVVARGGEGSAKAVAEQARDLDRFTHDERRMLLSGLASESFRAGDVEQSRRLWLALAEHEPGDLSVRLVLFDLALQADDEKAMRPPPGRLSADRGS